MAESKQHKQIAKRIADRDGVAYPPSKGPDVARPDRVTEVGVDPARVREEMSQVARFRKPARYIAGPPPFVRKALGETKGTGIGVRDQYGNIVKRAGGRKK